MTKRKRWRCWRERAAQERMLCGLALCVFVGVAKLSASEFFESSVRPTLAGICGECHGATKQKGGLRLDHREGLLQGGDSGPAIIVGDPDNSLLIQAVRRLNDDVAMPPKQALEPRQVEALAQWIASGAEWPAGDVPRVPQKTLSERRAQHWAYQPVLKRTAPQTQQQQGVQSTVDSFVLAKLEANELEPSPPADRRTLIRRAYVNLLGFPPPAKDVEAFEADPRPDAFDRLIDQLLSRPEYGEQWGRHWLDIARYADAKGYIDAGEVKYPFAYTYRDYVIRSFNQDLPYDVFLREQIAADQFTDRHPESLAALGFLTVGSRFNIFPHEIIDDRIDVVTRGVLGLSVACARCHDHKYDPVPSVDYYSLYSIFANSREPTLEQVPLLHPDQQVESDDFAKKLQDKAKAYYLYREKLRDKIAFELRAWSGDYLRYVVQTSPQHRTDEQPELQTERGLIRAVSAYATGGVHRWREYLDGQSVDDPVFGLWVRLAAVPRDQFEEEVSQILQRNQGVSWNPLVLRALTEQPLRTMLDVANAYASVFEQVDAAWRELVADDPAIEAFGESGEEQVRMALYGPDAPGTLDVEDAYDYCTLDESVELRKAFAEVERVFLETWDQSSPRPMMMLDRPDSRKQHVFVRGDPLRLGKEVPHAVPASLGVAQPLAWLKGSGRRELAEVVSSNRNPLTARVLVNRVWAWHFGRGLVEPLSDFGTRSELPSHPALLDYLAFEFMRHDWSIKWLQRTIMRSATWQQASHDRVESRMIDPENRWLWRQNRRRLRFEEMRDAMLFVSGELVDRAGGTPVRIAPDAVANRYRTLYTFVDREKLENVFRVFDFPSPDFTATKRSQTTVPQQSLFLLNSPFVLHQAQMAVGRARRGEGGADKPPSSTDVVRQLFRVVLSRDPEPSELEAMVAFVGMADNPTSDPFVEVAQTLILCNEFLFVD